jgi:hypothetical protein
MLGFSYDSRSEAKSERVWHWLLGDSQLQQSGQAWQIWGLVAIIILLGLERGNVQKSL